jgi:F420-non-reducing hydrogenase large subunit
MQKITIDPITRLEGHGKIEIFLNEKGDVENAYLQVPDYRGFERFCVGRPAEEMPRITQSICGVCPWAHHMASTKALDDLYKVEVPSAAKKLRELVYSVYSFYDKIIHFYYLAAPDFVVGPDAPKQERNVVGLIQKVGLDVGKEVIKNYALAQTILEKIGGRKIHPVFGLPGGVSKPITEEDRKDIIEKAKGFVEFGKFSLKIFEDVVLKNKKYLDIVLSDTYYLKTYYMGLVDKKNRVNFYDGDIRVVDEEGKEYIKFKPQDYTKHIAEQVVEWSYLKFPYLKAIGWKGLVEGKDNGIYSVAPLARLNAADGMATPLANEEYEKMFKTLGGKPVHNTLATHWARLIELLYSAERALELAQDEEVTSKNIRTIPTNTPKEGIGVVEAPRGTLFHHYFTDEKGIIQKVNLIVATGNNYSSICLSIKKAAQKLIKEGKYDDGLLNMVEMAFRIYDPCLSCATHTFDGKMNIEVNIYDKDKNLIRQIRS